MASAFAHEVDSDDLNPINLRLPALSDRDIAAGWAQDVLGRLRMQSESVEFALPPSRLGLEAGDTVSLDVGPIGRSWQLTASDGLVTRDCTAQAAHLNSLTLSGPEPALNTEANITSRPLLVLLDIPHLPGSLAKEGFWAVAHANPWPGSVTLFAGADIETADERAHIAAPGFVGRLLAPLGAGAEGRWDRGNEVHVELLSGSLSSATTQSVLNGGNRLAIETSEGWEVLAFSQAQLQSDGSWMLSNLLRGLGGTPSIGAQAGARIVVLDEAGVTLEIADFERDVDLTILAVPPGQAINDVPVRQITAQFADVADRPLAPVHLKAQQSGDALDFNWVRRARHDSDAWDYGDVALDEVREAYQVTLLDGLDAVSIQEVTGPSFTLSAADRADLFPAGLATAQIAVAQVSDRFGPGLSANLGLASFD